MNIKEQIRAEIENRIAANKTKNGFPAGTICAIRIETYDELLAFLDTIPEQPVRDHHEIEVEFRGEKVTISREFYRDGERNYSTSEQDDNAIWAALRAWCEKKGITPFELYPKQPEQPVLPGIDEEGIHELRESEDERIRKWLVDYFTEIGENWIHREFTCKQIVAYLEKKKEHQNNSDAPNESSWSGMISSSDKDKNLDEIAQDYVDGVKEYNPEPTWDLVQTAVCYGYYLAEQKEQKPDDDPLNDPKFIKGFETGREVQRIFDEKKPAEWSEEDDEELSRSKYEK